MKDVLKKIAPLFLLCIYSLIAGGSGENIGVTIGIIIAIIVVAVIIATVYLSSETKKESEEGLAKAKEQFGEYTDKIEYKHGKYILYDAGSNRILLNGSIVDSTKLAELKTTERAESRKVTYKEEQVTKTSTGSALGRGVAGALIAGPVGAVIGGATAKKTTETKKTPDVKVIPGFYTIDVIDADGNSRGKFSTSVLSEHYALEVFLQKIIDSNTKDTRLALEQAAEEAHQQLLESKVEDLTPGASVDSVKSFLSGSNVEEIADGKRYNLCAEAVMHINQGLNANFEKVSVIIKDEFVSILSGLSSSHTAGGFQNMLLEVSSFAKTLIGRIGNPTSAAAEIKYTSLTEDNNLINAYTWLAQGESETKIDVICDKGKYRYLFTSGKK